VPFTIYIDNTPDPGTVMTTTNEFIMVGTGTQTAPVLCPDMGTRLKHTTSCGKTKWWEYCPELWAPSPLQPCSNVWGTWTVEPGSETPIWWTGYMPTTRRYRALVENGTCQYPANSVYSPEILVKIKPPLTASIAASAYNLCENPILTATTSYGAPCNYPVSCQWYLNGALIPNATGQTYQPGQGQAGNYTVLVSDAPCGNSAWSLPVTICDPKLVVTHPCCVCRNETLTLEAAVVDACGTMSCSYHWSTGANTSSIQVTYPGGTYTVTATCGTCQWTETVTVDTCPPRHH